MDVDKLNQRLESDHQRTKNFIEEGTERLLAHYRENIEEPRDFPPLEYPPHEYLMRRGIRLIAFASSETFDSIRTGTGRSHAKLPLIGIGLESLLNGIHLKVSTDSFLNYIEVNDGDTPSLSKSKGVVLEDLSNYLPEDILRSGTLILRTFHIHRNNSIHLDFHSEKAQYRERLVLDLAYELFLFYANERISEFQKIDAIIKNLQDREVDSITSKFEFDPDATLWKQPYT